MTMSMEEEMVTREQGRGTYYRFSLLVRTVEAIRSENANSDSELEAATVTSLDASNDRCSCDSLPSEVLARIFELVTESTWKDGFHSTPSAVEMSSYPGRGVGGTAGVGDQLVTVDIDGSSLFRIYPYISSAI